jgi:probable addiction module antidote protein
MAYRVANVAKKTGRSRTSLYKALSKDADPRFSTILDILRSVHIKLDFQKTATGKKAA